MSDVPQSKEGYPLSLHDQLSEWAEGRMATEDAIRL